jgi:hypothetical protein
MTDESSLTSGTGENAIEMVFDESMMRCSCPMNTYW